MQRDTSSHDRETPVTYFKKEVDLIRQMIVSPGTDLTCPRCNALLESETIAGRGTIEQGPERRWDARGLCRAATSRQLAQGR